MREVNYLTDKSQDSEKLLSFKEQILRDLEEANEQLLKIEKEYDLPDRSIETPSSLKEEEEATPPPKVEESALAPKEEPVEPVKATPAVEEKSELTKPAKKEPTQEPVEESLSRSSRNQRQQKQKKQNKIAKRIVRTVVSLLLIVIVATGIFAVTYIHSAVKPMDKNATEFVTVEIPAGSSNREIGAILEKKGLVKNGQFFNYYTKFKNYSNFKSGYFNLQKSMDLETIIQKLQEEGTKTPQAPVLGKVTIPEGYTIDQIATAITADVSTKKAGKTPFKKEDFLKAVQDDAFIEKMVAKYPKLLANLPSKDSGVRYRLEGYLFPATYNYGKDTTVKEMIDQMLAAMDQNLSPYYETLESKNINVNEVLTLASLVEKEGATDQDRKDIASVFYNRLNQDMPLQSNIAILYAEGKLGQKTTLKEDATIDEVKRAARIAQATDFIEEKEEKYDSPIAQGGSNVSGGQKQRLSIARAIAKDPEIYIFDDSFSALDYKTDVKLRSELQKETNGSTTLIVAQRISTILHADQIIVLDEGNIVGKGTHEELLNTCPVYQQIAKSQLSEDDLKKAREVSDHE